MVKKIALSKSQYLSPLLAEVLGVPRDEMLSKVEVMRRLWNHIKSKKLQDTENKHFVIPDEKIARLVGKERIKAFGMVKYLKQHLLTK